LYVHVKQAFVPFVSDEDGLAFIACAEEVLLWLF